MGFREDKEKTKLGGSYRKSIFLRQNVKGSQRGLYDYLQATFTSPGGLRRALIAMRTKNPQREYVTSDPNIA